MVDYETISSKNIPFGRNNFIEVARKKAKTGNGEKEFISISRGYFQPDDTKRYKTSVTVPLDEEVRKQIAEELLKV